MDLFEVETMLLKGPALDWAVAIALGWKAEGTVEEYGYQRWLDTEGVLRCSAFSPSTDWNQCGPLLYRFKVWLSPPADDEHPIGWDAEIYDIDGREGAKAIGCETPQIAVCRAIAAVLLGEAVMVPDSLLEW